MKDKISKDLIEFIKDLVISIIIVLIITKVIIFPCKVDGSSMYPNLVDGQVGFSLRITKTFKINRFDIAIIDLEEENTKYLVKRVIGLPNETLEYKDNILYINGEKINEDFLEGTFTEDLKIVLGDDEYYCLGDNRTSSLDSRVRGPFKKDQIVATHVFVLHPFENFGFNK